jgi:hypothetical protein
LVHRSKRCAKQRPRESGSGGVQHNSKDGALLVALNAVLAVSIDALNAFIPAPFAGDLIHAFTESFKAGLADMAGLLAGWAATSGALGRRG